MNIFRLLGDISHLASICILIRTIVKDRTIEGISFKTQSLYVLVFLTRYLDILQFVSLYNTLMKVFFVCTSVYIVVCLQRGKTENPIAYKDMIMQDTFKIQYLLAGAAVMAILFNHAFTPSKLLWSFSVWLESVAILPQLFMLSKSGKAKSLTVHYIFALGFYRAMYIPNWAWRYFKEGRFDKLAIAAGIVQTLIYSDFFYIYYVKVIKGKGFEFPK